MGTREGSVYKEGVTGGSRGSQGSGRRGLQYKGHSGSPRRREEVPQGNEGDQRGKWSEGSERGRMMYRAGGEHYGIRGITRDRWKY